MSDHIVMRGAPEIEKDRWRESYGQWVGGDFGKEFHREVAALCEEMKAGMVRSHNTEEVLRQQGGVRALEVVLALHAKIYERHLREIDDERGRESGEDSEDPGADIGGPIGLDGGERGREEDTVRSLRSIRRKFNGEKV